MNRHNLFWGLALLVLGLLLLADNLGLLGGVNVWAIFWPLALIALGVRILWRSTDHRDAWTTRSAGDTSLRTADSPSIPAGRRAGEAVRLPLQGARRATLHFHHGAGELRLDAAAAPDELLSGIFEGGLDHRLSGGPDEVTVDLSVPAGTLTPLDFNGGLNWTLGVNPVIPLALDMELGASRNRLDLHALQVKDLRLQTGASATEVMLPERAGEVRVVIRAGAASVQLSVPENVSARIHAGGGLSSTQINTARFPQVGPGEYCSPDYEVAANKVDIDVETGLGSVNVR